MPKLIRSVFVVLAFFVLLVSPSHILATNYYVSGSGSDASSGSEQSPYATIQKGINTLRPGDTLYIRAGNYSVGRLDISSKNGTETSPITIAGYPGERPTIDAEGKVASLWDLFVGISSSSYLTIENLEFKNSRGRGIYIGSGHHITLKNIWVHHTALAAVWSDNISDLTIEDSRFWMNNLVNYKDSGNPWYQAEMWMGTLHPRGPDSTTSPHATGIIIRRNEISQGFGECINMHGRISGAIIEDNTIHDCWAPAIYFPNDQDILIQGNKVYHTNDPRFLREGNPSAGIGAMKEGSPTRPGEMKNIRVLNNYVKGFNSNFFFWQNMGGYLENITVSGNTFVDAHSNTGSGNNISISAGPHKNAIFTNNTIIQTDTTAGIGRSDGSFTFSNNAWSTKPATNMQSAGDTVATSDSTPTPSPDVIVKSGDANLDNSVNDSDYSSHWKPNYRAHRSGPAYGDFNHDNVVDGVDYVIWLNNYGK